MQSEMSQTQKNIVQFHLYEASEWSDSHRWKLDWGVAGARGWGMWGVSVQLVQSFSVGS